MTGSQKNCFMAVASLRSYTKAAKQLHISQPAVTKQVQMLERDLRITLLERDKRTVQLTRNGEKFYHLIQRQDLEMNEFLDDARQYERSYCGTVRVGLLCGWDIHILHDHLLTDFKATYPNTQVQVVMHYFADLYRLLVEDEVDLVMTLQSMLPRDQQIQIRGIGTVRRTAAIANNHPLAGKPDLDIRDLADDPFYIIQADEANWLYFRNNMQSEHGVDPMLSLVPNYPTQLTYIRNGRGVALLDEFCQKDTKEDYRMIPLNFSDKVVLARKNENVSSETRAVEDYIAEFFKTHSGLGLL